MPCAYFVTGTPSGLLINRVLCVHAFLDQFCQLPSTYGLVGWDIFRFEWFTSFEVLSRPTYARCISLFVDIFQDPIFIFYLHLDKYFVFPYFLCAIRIPTKQDRPENNMGERVNWAKITPFNNPLNQNFHFARKALNLHLYPIRSSKCFVCPYLGHSNLPGVAHTPVPPGLILGPVVLQK